jgi:hypothetical protein
VSLHRVTAPRRFPPPWSIDAAALTIPGTMDLETLRNGGILGDKMSVPRQAKNCRILAQPIFGRMRETAVIAVTVAVGFWFFGVWSGT